MKKCFVLIFASLIFCLMGIASAGNAFAQSLNDLQNGMQQRNDAFNKGIMNPAAAFSTPSNQNINAIKGCGVNQIYNATLNKCVDKDMNAVMTGQKKAGDLLKTPKVGLDSSGFSIGEQSESTLSKATQKMLSDGLKPSGSTTSGNVEKPSFVGSSNLSSEYYGADSCGGGNIFQQLACRAGTIGSGLKTAGYMIAGFGLIVFAFAAIFGKVKWPLFATIAFSCFLLSITMAVINMMTKDGEQWMGDVSGAGSISTSATDQPKGNTDANEVSKDKS
ncbi:MAG: hypothetical protein J6N45_02885 [Alphaproteobacteria bacterium]|nr:hypothetical protein [Alphaproteobacteria bacterium]